MKSTLLYATTIFLILGVSSAHEVAVSPEIAAHRTIVEARIVQFNETIGARCTTRYFTMKDGAKNVMRKSVDCEE